MSSAIDGGQSTQACCVLHRCRFFELRFVARPAEGLPAWSLHWCPLCSHALVALERVQRLPHPRGAVLVEGPGR